MDTEKINHAIETHYGLWWTEERKQAIREEIGTDGLAQIEAIAAFADDTERWMYADPAQAYAETQTVLRERYPFLSPLAVIKLTSSAAYSWK